MSISNPSQNAEKIKLSKADIRMIGYNFDELGRVFSWDGRIFRFIYPEKKEVAKHLLSCGLIEELTQKGLFPKTTVAPYTLEESDFVLEHEKIHPVILHANWSFDMLKDAALCLLEVNKIARKYGYQTIDGHGLNILFRSGKPVFIDLGSFIKNTENPKGWKAYEQFVQCFYYPLKIFKTGNFYLGRAISREKNRMPHSSYYLYRYPLLRFFSSHKISKFFEAYYKFKSFSHFSTEEIQKRAPKRFQNILTYLKKNKIPFLQTVHFDQQIRKFQRIKLPPYQSQWGGYHDIRITEGGRKISSTQRYDRILAIIKELAPHSVMEAGGNQGVFSELILQHTAVQHIICTDYDEIAVNKMYNRIKFKSLDIAPSLLDIISPSKVAYGSSVEERYRSEMVIALALTHHLILGQKVPLSKILGRFSKFSSKYIVTEFMPLGLYSPTAKRNERPPEWYTETWFQKEFEKHFNLLNKETLDKNRILFVGKKREIKNP